MTRRSFLLRFPSAIAVLLAGCTASGTASLVKLSPDGRYVLCQDAVYPTAYLYDVRTGKSTVLAGEVVYMDRTLEHLILTPCQRVGSDFEAVAITPTLVEVSDGHVSRRLLPCLHPGFAMTHAYFDRDAASEEVVACLYGDQRLEPCRAYARWRPGEAEWTITAFPEQPFAAINDYYNHGPRGARASGPVYCRVNTCGPEVERIGSLWATEEEILDSQLQIAGVGLERDFSLRSPDGQYLARASDPADPWKRATLTDQTTGRKTILVEKNNAAAEVGEVVFEVTVINPACAVMLTIAVLLGYKF